MTNTIFIEKRGTRLCFFSDVNSSHLKKSRASFSTQSKYPSMFPSEGWWVHDLEVVRSGRRLLLCPDLLHDSLPSSLRRQRETHAQKPTCVVSLQRRSSKDAAFPRYTCLCMGPSQISVCLVFQLMMRRREKGRQNTQFTEKDNVLAGGVWWIREEF